MYLANLKHPKPAPAGVHLSHLRVAFAFQFAVNHCNFPVGLCSTDDKYLM